MTVLPIHHVNGIVVTTIAPLTVGASVVLNRQFSASHFWQRIAAEGVTISSVVPTILQFLLEAADKDLSGFKNLTGLRYLICGAGTLSVALAQKFEERFGVKIIHGYGLSEVTAYASHLPIDLTPEEHRHWLSAYGYPSIGCALDVNELAIFDVNGEGHELAAGERGELAIRGHNVMQGYFQRPDANRETFKYGWFRSGDEGFYQTDAQGRKFFFITGRIKELINRGGVKFSPFDIEEALDEIPGVRVGLAIAFENKYYGEEVGAYVVVETGMHLSEETVLDYCRKRLGFEKSPKVVVFGPDAPVTATGKYQRLLLREKFAEWKETQFRAQ
jgi:long-chain acyl-CoA synthetase